MGSQAVQLSRLGIQGWGRERSDVSATQPWDAVYPFANDVPQNEFFGAWCCAVKHPEGDWSGPVSSMGGPDGGMGWDARAPSLELAPLCRRLKSLEARLGQCQWLRQPHG